MRSRVLLGLVTFLLLSWNMALAEGQTASKLNVRRQFDVEISQAKNNLSSEKRLEQKWKILSKAESQIEHLRKENSLQSDADEIYMDTVIQSLQQIPRQGQFQKKECANYKSHILAGFDPHGAERPNPALAQTLSILNILCDSQ